MIIFCEIHAQRRSYVAAEMAIGSDSDEAAYRAALDAGDHAKITQLQEEGEARWKLAL